MFFRFRRTPESIFTLRLCCLRVLVGGAATRLRHLHGQIAQLSSDLEAASIKGIKSSSKIYNGTLEVGCGRKRKCACHPPHVCTAITPTARVLMISSDCSLSVYFQISTSVHRQNSRPIVRIHKPTVLRSPAFLLTISSDRPLSVYSQISSLSTFVH